MFNTTQNQQKRELCEVQKALWTKLLPESLGKLT